jgi:RNA polymerase sigma-70 factor (ECF subfamily)
VDWDAQFDEYGPLVYRICRRILGNAADVEDALQEAFLQAFRLQQTQRVRHWGALFRRLATCNAIRLLRKRRAAALTDVASIADCEAPPDEVAVRRELEARFREAVAELPEREGAVFCLRYFEGCSNPEIAAAMGIKTTAVATAMSRARAKLQRVFQETPQGEEP